MRRNDEKEMKTSNNNDSSIKPRIKHHINHESQHSEKVDVDVSGLLSTCTDSIRSQYKLFMESYLDFVNIGIDDFDDSKKNCLSKKYHYN